MHFIGAVFDLHGHRTVPWSSQFMLLTNQPHCLPADCGPFPQLTNSEVVWLNSSVVIHRCVPGYHSWRGSNTSVCGDSGLWLEATLTCIGEHHWMRQVNVWHYGGKKREKPAFTYLIEIKPPITQLLIFNERCLRWRAEKYEGDTEVYKVAEETF